MFKILVLGSVNVGIVWVVVWVLGYFGVLEWKY